MPIRYEWPVLNGVSDLREHGYSALLIRQYCPHVTKVPVRVDGDGNCLFNSVSVTLCGNNSLATELRLRTVIEMTCNKKFYLGRPCSGQFMLFSDYDESIIDCTKDGGYSSVWTICAVSTVIGRPITCLYPSVNGFDDVPASELNVTLHPRREVSETVEPITIMWTRVEQSSCSPWIPNHFVPLLDRALIVSPQLVPPSSPEVVNNGQAQTDISEEFQPGSSQTVTDPQSTEVELPSLDDNALKLVEAHKGGFRLWHNGYAYVRDKVYKDKV